MLKVNGAFAPARRTPSHNRCYWADTSPPERFVATHLSGGLKFLYQRLSHKKKIHQPKYEQGLQTSEDGKFQPCFPVPLLAERYKFVQVIGRGQSAILVGAEDCFHPNKKAVALKIMHLDYSRLGAQEAECIQELNKADKLRVSRTVQLLNKFSFDGHYCMVFELLRPRPLHQYFQRCQFDNKEAKLKLIRKIALQLLQALGFLKRENVIHADLKPENILLEEGEEIKVKVVDFGNAIHCVHREVSLYYDEFELQTLLYRAPEVMFGVPFGPEIDIWSLGCILAELYIGKPLFLGRNKKEVLEEMTLVLGPAPKNPFQSGKFFQDLSGFVDQTPENKPAVFECNMMKKLHNTRNFPFASFLVGLLQYNPSERLSPFQAAVHPFLAPDLPFAYLLPQQGEKIPDGAGCYTNVLVTPQQYNVKPHVDEEIRRQHFTGTELLYRGTTEISKNPVSSGSPLTGEVTSLLPNQTRDGGQKALTLSSNVRTGKELFKYTELEADKSAKDVKTTPVENSRYAMEGPLTISKTASPLLEKKSGFAGSHGTKVKSKFVNSAIKKTKSYNINLQAYSSALPSEKHHSHVKPTSRNLLKDKHVQLHVPDVVDIFPMGSLADNKGSIINKRDIGSLDSGIDVKLGQSSPGTVNCPVKEGVATRNLCSIPSTRSISSKTDIGSLGSGIDVKCGKSSPVTINRNVKGGLATEHLCSVPSTSDAREGRAAENDDRLAVRKEQQYMHLQEDDKSSGAARTCVYYRKTKSRHSGEPALVTSQFIHSVVEEQSDNKSDDKGYQPGNREHSSVKHSSVAHNKKTSMANKRKKFKLQAITPEQDSGKAGHPSRYEEDVVMLL